MPSSPPSPPSSPSTPWALLSTWRGRPGPRRAQRPVDLSGGPSPSTRGHRSTPHSPTEWQSLLAGAPALPPLTDGTTDDPGAPLAPHEADTEACGWHDSSWTLLQGLIVLEGPPAGPLLHPEMIENAAYPPAFYGVLQASA